MFIKQGLCTELQNTPLTARPTCPSYESNNLSSCSGEHCCTSKLPEPDNTSLASTSLATESIESKSPSPLRRSSRLMITLSPGHCREDIPRPFTPGCLFPFLAILIVAYATSRSVAPGESFFLTRKHRINSEAYQVPLKSSVCGFGQ